MRKRPCCALPNAKQQAATSTTSQSRITPAGGAGTTALVSVSPPSRHSPCAWYLSDEVANAGHSRVLASRPKCPTPQARQVMAEPKKILKTAGRRVISRVTDGPHHGPRRRGVARPHGTATGPTAVQRRGRSHNVIFRQVASDSDGTGSLTGPTSPAG